MTRDDIISEVRVVPVRISARTLWRHVMVASREGIVGVGEASYDAAPPDMEQRLLQAGNALVGQPLSKDVLSPLEPLTGRSMADATVYSALEQALMDLRGQHAGQPCFRLLRDDAYPGPIALYANINRKTESRRAEDFAAHAVQAEREGFQAVKLAPFDHLTPALAEEASGQHLITRGIERITAVAAAISPETELQVDCHWRFSPRTATRLVNELAELNVRWLECPLPETTGNISDLARIRSQANSRGIRLAGLENFCGWKAFEPYVLGGCYDVIMPDIKHCGGYRMMLEIAEQAERNGVAVSPHNPSGPVSHQASVHAATAIGGNERLEVQWRESPLFECITHPSAHFDNGLAQAVDGPGLGVSLTTTAQ